MTVVDCASCRYLGRTTAMRPFTVSRDHNRKIGSATFEYFDCPVCGYVALDPVPANLGDYYRADYYDIPKDLAQLRDRAKRLQSWKLDRLLQHKRGGRLLEIGPAYGMFSCLAKDAGFDVSVIEMDARSCVFLRDVLGVSVTNTVDTAAAIADMPLMDAIVAWQVIEHIPDPFAVLKAAAATLNPGGVLILDTPNPEAFQFRLLKSRWAHLDALRHVNLIPARLLKEHLETCGLECETMTASDVSANGFNGFGWAESFKAMAPGLALGHVAHFAGRALGKLLAPIERTGWRGSTYTAVFRKPERAA